MILKAATKDNIALAMAIEPRFLDICGMHMQKKGTELVVPESMAKPIKLWRTALLRFREGDFRIGLDEEKGMQEFAQWTVDIHMELRNQEKKTVTWI